MKTSTSLKENLLKLRAKRYIAEGEMQTAEAALAAKDLVDRLQDSVEDLSKMTNEELPHLVDAIRGSFGDEKANQYQATANTVLSSLLDQVKQQKSTLENATLVLTGDAQAAGPDLGLDDQALPAPDEDLDDLDKDADDVEGEKAPLGRGVRPEARVEARKIDYKGYKIVEYLRGGFIVRNLKNMKISQTKTLTEAKNQIDKMLKKKRVAEGSDMENMDKGICSHCGQVVDTYYGGRTAGPPGTYVARKHNNKEGKFCTGSSVGVKPIKKKPVAEGKKGKKPEKEGKKVSKNALKQKEVAEAAIRKALSKACPDCKAKSGEKCKHLKNLKESVQQFGGVHISRWQSVLSESKVIQNKRYKWGFEAGELPEELNELEVDEFEGHTIASTPYDGDVYGVIDGHEYVIGWAHDDYLDVADILESNPDLKKLGPLAQVVARYEMSQRED